MVLLLRYRVNEGVNITEHLEDGERKSVDVVVRRIYYGDVPTSVNFELIEENNSPISFTLSEGQRYDVLPFCTLGIPENPLRGDPQEGGQRVMLKYFAPRSVVFGDRTIYDDSGKPIKITYRKKPRRDENGEKGKRR